MEDEEKDLAKYEERKKVLEQEISVALLNMEEGEKTIITNGGLQLTVEKKADIIVLGIAETELEIGRIENLEDNKVVYNEENLKALVEALENPDRPIRRPK